MAQKMSGLLSLGFRLFFQKILSETERDNIVC